MNERMTDNELDDLIRRELLSVSASAELRQKLLQPEQLKPRFTTWFGAANDSVFRRLLPVAACLVAALGIALWTVQDSHAALEEEIFTHMYLEGQLDNADAAVIPLDAVNARMESWMGAHLKNSSDVEGLKVTFAKDCWVAKQMAFHLIMRGHTGAVTVMMIPDKGRRDEEFNIGDEQYSGLVTPTDGGYLVVVGNKHEPIAEYRNLLSSKLEWEY